MWIPAEGEEMSTFKGSIRNKNVPKNANIERKATVINSITMISTIYPDETVKFLGTMSPGSG